MADVELRALKDFSYSTRRLKAGDMFTVSERDAKILRAIKKADFPRAKASVPAPPARVVAQAQTQAPAEDFLDRAIPAIVGDLPGLDSAVLRQHLAAEKRGKGRKGLITAFEAELDARKG